MPHLRFSPKAAAQLAALDNDKGLAKRGKAVRRALAKLEVNLRHPSLNTHEFHSVPCPHGGKLFEAYAENNTPAAYRIFWCYDPDQKDTVLIVAITPHP